MLYSLGINTVVRVWILPMWYAEYRKEHFPIISFMSKR